MVWLVLSGVWVRAIVLALVSTHRCKWLPSVGYFGVLEFLDVRPCSFSAKRNTAYNEKVKADIGEFLLFICRPGNV
jgi:hypothetical protein